VRRSANLSVGLVVALVAMVLVYQKLRNSESKPPSEIDLAVSALGEDGEAERERAHEFLLEAESDAVESLLQALSQEDVRRPEEIIRALVRIGDEQAISALREVLGSHPDALARRAAASALAEMPDREAGPLLQQRIESDPALQVRQAALVALADLGDESLLYDLAALLDPTTVAELREAAGDTLEVITDQDFGLDRQAAEAWLDEHDAGPAKSVVAGALARPGEPLLESGPTPVRIERGDDRLRIELTGRLALPMHLLLQLDGSRIVIELEQAGEQVTARCFDTPETGRRIARHAEIAVESAPGALRFSIPRAGQLVSPDLPRAVTVISAGS